MGVEVTMDEFSGSLTRDAPPPSPPQWRGTQSLELVYQLNERCIDALCEIAIRNSPEVKLEVVVSNRELWARLDADGRRAFARVPFLIVDAHFREEAWWRRVAEEMTRTVSHDGECNDLPRELAEQLMHETTMFAWQTARWDRTVARLSLGMTSGVVAIVAALTPQQIRIIATTQSGGIRVRWDDDVQFWRELLIAANAKETRKLAELHLIAKLRLCGDIAQLRSHRL
jgi:hypothetical protein